MAWAKPTVLQRLNHKISIFYEPHECSLAPGKIEAFTVIQKGFGPFYFKLAILLEKRLKETHEKVVGRAHQTATMIFIKYEKKDQF